MGGERQGTVATSRPALKAIITATSRMALRWRSMALGCMIAVRSPVETSAVAEVR